MSGDQTLTGLPAKDAYGSTDPNLPPAVEEFRLTARDHELLRECQLESVQQRCLPFALLFGAGTHLAIKTGRLPPHPRFGSAFKVLAASLTGIFLGKLAYVPVCRKKLKADPLSELGRKFREKDGGNYYFEPNLGAPPPETQMTPRGDESAPPPPPAPSYDDMRRRNRMGADSGALGRAPPPPPPSQPPPYGQEPRASAPNVPSYDYGQPGPNAPGYDYGQPDASADPPSLMRRPRKRVNAYGDELEDV